MRKCLPLVAAAILGLVSAVSAQMPLVCPPAKTEPVTTAPQGAYMVARLEISAGLQDAKDKAAPAPQKLHIALRDGKLANVWFVLPMDGDSRFMVEQSTLALKGDALAGEVEFRTAPGRGKPQSSVKLTLSLTRTGEKLAGEYAIAAGAVYKSAKGTASGTLATAAGAENAVSAQGAWTSFWGPNGDMSTQPQPALVEDLAKARPVWRSETYVPTAYGNAPDSRYASRAIVTGNGGGGSSPIIAGGVVYMYFYAPSPQVEPATKGNPYWAFGDGAELKKKMAALNANERETGLLLNHFRPVADDHIVAIDAASGAEKWHTVLPLRSPNLQTHKHRGVSGVPLIVGDTLYVPNLMSRLYAIDAKTGAVKWELPEFKLPEKAPAVAPPSAPSPMMLGDTLVFGRGETIGIDPASGKLKWKADGAYPMRWTSGGKSRLVGIVWGGKAFCLDASDGKKLWEQATNLQTGAPLSAVIAGDMLIASPPGPKGVNELRYEGWKLSDTGVAKVWQDANLPGDENVPVTVVDGKAYLLGRQLIRVLDVATGKQVAEKRFTTNGPGSNPWLGVVGERFLFLPEGQHGTAHLAFLDRELKEVGPFWLPPNVNTTAYNSQPVVYPIVEGRMFLRGGDGIYCYDLRKK